MIGVRVGPMVTGDNTQGTIVTEGDTNPGELLLLSVFIRSVNQPTIQPPAGWTLRGSALDRVGIFTDLHVWSRVADGSALDRPAIQLSAPANPDGFHCRMVAVTDATSVVDQNTLSGTTLLRANAPVLEVAQPGSRIFWYAAQLGSEVPKIPLGHNAMEVLFQDHSPAEFRGDVFCYRSRQTEVPIGAWSAAWITGTHNIVQVAMVVR